MTMEGADAEATEVAATARNNTRTGNAASQAAATWQQQQHTKDTEVQPAKAAKTVTARQKVQQWSRNLASLQQWVVINDGYDQNCRCPLFVTLAAVDHS